MTALLPLAPDGSLHAGFISVLGHEYYLKVSAEPGGSLRHARSGARARVAHSIIMTLFVSTLPGSIEGDWALAELLAGLEPLVQQRLVQSSTVADFVQELVQLVTPRLQQRPPPPLPAMVMAALAGDLDAFGWEHVRAVSPDLLELTLARADVRGREHLVRVQLKPECVLLVCCENGHVDTPQPQGTRLPPPCAPSTHLRRLSPAGRRAPRSHRCCLSSTLCCTRTRTCGMSSTILTTTRGFWSRPTGRAGAVSTGVAVDLNSSVVCF
jgi:hypothetical protein